MVIKAYAKINLALDVLKKRDDGYHDVSMIMQTVSLCDTVDVLPIHEENKTTTTTDKADIPNMEDNIAHKAAILFFKENNLPKSAKIFIKKHIPSGAGLAGGSSDAAAVLIALNEIFKTHLSKEQLCEIGVKIGADVPYCILKNTYLAEGIGEKLTKLHNFLDCSILIVKPDIHIPTPWVYKNLKLTKNTIHPPIAKIIESIENENYEFIFENASNVLESVTAKEYPQIEEIKINMKKCGAKMSLMSGSGSSVFGIFTDENKCVDAYNYFKNTYSDTFLTKTISHV